MNTGSAFLFIWILFGATMLVVGLCGTFTLSPMHQVCALIDPPTPLEAWRYER